MGYLTVLTLHNDAEHVFREHAAEFGPAILDGIGRSTSYGRETSVPFHCYSNYISVHPPRHAHDTALFLFHGNGLTNINPYDNDFESLMKNNPSLAEDFIKIAENQIKDAKRRLKEFKNKK